MPVKTTTQPVSVYELAISVRSEWQAHSMSNIGSHGTNRLLPRRQVLAGGQETDACSGDILKHHHAALVAEYFEAERMPLCPSCSIRDARRAGALADTRTADISLANLLRCPQCDIHGFLLTGRRSGGSTPALPARSKDSVLDFSYALAEPDTFDESIQINVRRGNADVGDPMILRSSCRSGAYALCIRYKCAAVGVDTYSWQPLIEEDERLRRHQCVLRALRDQILSPDGARTTGMLPHVTGVRGAIVLRSRIGRAYICSPLRQDFVEQLKAAAAATSDSSVVLCFDKFEDFARHMEYLIAHSVPCTPQKQTLGDLGS